MTTYCPLHTCEACSNAVSFMPSHYCCLAPLLSDEDGLQEYAHMKAEEKAKLEGKPAH